MFKTIATISFAHVCSARPRHQAQQAPRNRRRSSAPFCRSADIPGTNLEVIYATVEIAPGFKAGRHSHPGVVMAQVVEGEFWFAPDGQPEKIFKAGEALTVPDRAIHNEGATDKGVKLNAVYAVEKGQPLASPAK